MSKSKKLGKKYKLVPIILVVLIFLAISAKYLHDSNIAVLNPKGTIAYQERQLIIYAVLLALIVVIPVFTLLGVFAYRYRETNTKAKYSPELDGNKIAETIWWVVPSAIILVLGIIAWNSSHTLDPYKAISSNKKPITIQVVALDWKWLFIYPKQNIATVNFFQVPMQTPINFQITSDAVMNSFWIPQLGGQIYAMPGMSTQLHLMASGVGSYSGVSANISGEGFAGMTFTAKSSSDSSFNNWVNSVKKMPQALTQASYSKLAQPSQNVAPIYYSSSTSSLYDTIIDKYMVPPVQSNVSNSNQGSQSQPSMQGMYMQ